MKNNAKKALALGILTSAFALTTFTGCEFEAGVSLKVGDYDDDQDNEMVLGTNPYSSREGVVSPYSVSEGYNEYGYPFTRYNYRASDLPSGVRYEFNNTSSKNVELDIQSSLRNVEFDIDNARLVTDYILGNSKVDVSVPCYRNEYVNGTYVDEYPKGVYAFVPVFEVEDYDSLTINVDKGAKIRKGNSTYIMTK